MTGSIKGPWLCTVKEGGQSTRDNKEKQVRKSEKEKKQKDKKEKR